MAAAYGDALGRHSPAQCGLTTKIHALVDAEDLPIALKPAEGQAHDGRSAEDMLEQIQAGQILLADRAYDTYAMRQRLVGRGAWATPNRRHAAPLACSYTNTGISSSASAA